jgi:16S rRNA (uracil1498-N3)-methyltransferase
MTIMVGPEGDFTPEEVALAKASGSRAVRLGRSTLRSETAAIAALAILQHNLGLL